MKINEKSFQNSKRWGKDVEFSKLTEMISFEGPPNSNIIKKETLAKMLSHQLCKIFTNPFLKEHLDVTTSAVMRKTTR